MKLKNTLVLLVVASIIAGFIWFYETKLPTTGEAAQNAGRVVQFDRDKITGITIKNTETKIELQKDQEGLWSLEKPLKDRADPNAIAQLFTTAEALKSEATVGSEKEAPTQDEVKSYGLANSETRITFSGPEKPVELLLGKDAAVEGKMYVKVAGSNAVHVITNDLKTQITKKVDDFRDRRLTAVTPTQVKKLTLKTKSGELELARKDAHWTLVQPLKARGDDQKIGDLVSQIANAHVESFVADSSNLSGFGLQEPAATVTLTSEGKVDPTTVQIGQPLADAKEKDKVAVKISTRDAVMLVPKSLESVVATRPNDLRDHKLVRVETDIVDRVTIEGAGQPKIVLARKGESWVRKTPEKDLPANTLAASRLLSELQNQQVLEFVADVATDLPKYGLDQPQVKITLSSFSSENTAETTAGEKPIVTILLGKSENGRTFAKLDDEPFVVSISSGLQDFAMTDPMQWQELAIYQNKSEDLTAVEIAKDGQPAVSLVRGADKKWTLAKGDGRPNDVNLQSMLNTLSTLRAVRWLGPVKPEYGLEKPTTVVTFKTGNGGGKLTIGAASGEGLNYATAEGLNGVFALSLPDVTAFQLPLLNSGAPPAPVSSAPANPPRGTTPEVPTTAAPSSPTAPQTEANAPAASAPEGPAKPPTAAAPQP